MSLKLRKHSWLNADIHVVGAKLVCTCACRCTGFERDFGTEEKTPEPSGRERVYYI